MIIPDFVKKGDKIAIISTARKINLSKITNSINALKIWGLTPVIGKTIGLENNQFAGSDEERTYDLQTMLDDPSIKAIWCACGGYGTVRIVDNIDFSNFIKKPKWIIGFSDITVLHAHLHNLNVASLHSLMPVNFNKAKEEAILSLQKTLFGKKPKYLIPPSKKNKLGQCRGQLIGGNLSILYSICGSKSTINTTGKILCIEDIDEYLYHVDRMLQNLKRNNYFDGLSGLIVGGMTKLHDNYIPFGKKVKGIILDNIKEYDFPVVFNFPMGHIPDNRTLILGEEVELTVSADEVKLEFI